MPGSVLLAALEVITVTARIYALCNQKGGVGKSTTTFHLARAAVVAGRRVLVVDNDPQGNASTALGIEHTADTLSIYDVLADEVPIADIIEAREIDVAPAGIGIPGQRCSPADILVDIAGACRNICERCCVAHAEV